MAAWVTGVKKLTTELPPAGGADPHTGRWFRVELRAERLDWLPPLLASLDLPFAVQRPDELRDLVAALASRLAASARRDTASQ
jgi:predicted DNA-binding transcriptional regulator YafY